MTQCKCGGNIIAYVKEDRFNVNSQAEPAYKCEKCANVYVCASYWAPPENSFYEMAKSVDEAYGKIPKWVKCSDRLPAKDGRYLVTEGWQRGDAWTGVCSLRQGKWDSNLIIAWQELPEPYKGDV